MYRENFINALRAEMVDMVKTYLSPVALKYGYSDVSLETNIKWRPIVLILGNYSSGKSTLINEFIGKDIQAVGQAPTDDSFTIITYDDSVPADTPVGITEERDGKFLLNDPEYPFEILKKHGQRFAAHFRLKKVNSPFLKNLALIDTPGMLDSLTERDRGYNYQDVIGDLAQLADLVLVLFDPHKAGTVREAHTSLRETISARTYEDRVLFVLNRIDECASLSDLLQVYGTLCWNLSQITGRKDIPTIHLTYSSRAAQNADSRMVDTEHFLYHLQNQRKKLKGAVLDAPRRRLDNLATFIETHAERLDQFLEAIMASRSKVRKFRFRFGFIGFIISLLLGSAAYVAEVLFAHLGGPISPIVIGSSAGIAVISLVIWFSMPMRYMTRSFLQRILKNIDQIIPLETQTRRDNWQAVRDLVYKYLTKTHGRFSLSAVRQEYATVHRTYLDGTHEVRRALNELANLRHEHNLAGEGAGRPFDEYTPIDPDEEPPLPDDTEYPSRPIPLAAKD